MPLGAELHGRCAAPSSWHDGRRCAALELRGHVLGHQLRVGLGLAHLLDVDEHLVVGERLHARELRLTLGGRVQVAALQDLVPPCCRSPMPGARGVDDDLRLVGGALDLHARDVGVVQVLLHGALDAQVRLEPLLVLAVLVPLARPGLDDPEPEAIRMVFRPMLVRPGSACVRRARCGCGSRLFRCALRGPSRGGASGAWRRSTPCRRWRGSHKASPRRCRALDLGDGAREQLLDHGDAAFGTEVEQLERFRGVAAAHQVDDHAGFCMLIRW